MRNENQLAEDVELPSSVRAEQTILGAMMVEPLALEDAFRMLAEQDFQLESHRAIFRAMGALKQRGMAVDITTLPEELGGCLSERLNNIGGVGYLCSICDNIPFRLSIESYARIVLEKAMLRRILTACDEAQRRCFAEEDSRGILADLQAALYRMDADYETEIPLETQAARAFEQLERERCGDRPAFVPTGISVVDKVHGGYAMGEFTVVAARPNVGKSTAIRQAVIANCEAGNFVHMFSPEMRADQILRCLWAAVARVPYHKVRHPERMNASEFAIVKGVQEAVARWPLKIDDTAGISPGEVMARVRSERRRSNTKLAIVDYFQKLAFKGRTQDRATEMTDACVGFTNLLKTEPIALVIVSSMTEDGNRAKGGIPTIHDLRGSGDIKYEANTIYLMHREVDGETLRLAPETLWITGKARSDVTGSERVYLDGPMQVFEDQATFLRRFRP